MPGKDHGQGGSGVKEIYSESGESVISALRLWWEKGEEPKYLWGKGILKNGEEFERIIYPETGESKIPPVCDEYYLNK